jgi:hypothetical protein
MMQHSRHPGRSRRPKRAYLSLAGLTPRVFVCCDLVLPSIHIRVTTDIARCDGSWICFSVRLLTNDELAIYIGIAKDLLLGTDSRTGRLDHNTCFLAYHLYGTL